MTHDECSSGNTDEQTKDDETGRGVDQTGTGGGDGCHTKDDCEQNTGSDLGTERTKDETHDDGTSDSDDVGCPNLFLGQAESVADFGQKRSDGEPDEECDEESPPGAVECSHVWTCKVAQLDFGGLVILVGIDVDGVLRVLFPFSLLKKITLARKRLREKIQI